MQKCGSVSRTRQTPATDALLCPGECNCLAKIGKKWNLDLIARFQVNEQLPCRQLCLCEPAVCLGRTSCKFSLDPCFDRRGLDVDQGAPAGPRYVSKYETTLESSLLMQSTCDRKVSAFLQPSSTCGRFFAWRATSMSMMWLTSVGALTLPHALSVSLRSRRAAAEIVRPSPPVEESADLLNGCNLRRPTEVKGKEAHHATKAGIPLHSRVGNRIIAFLQIEEDASFDCSADPAEACALSQEVGHPHQIASILRTAASILRLSSDGRETYELGMMDRRLRWLSCSLAV
mmetsp:Transcript_20937/g.30922  ORF Transcript_20937/g.30922 Transcript_20937/m.30922 type:complete len:288 (-) Transcript_20937:110-973(-)